MGRYNVYEPMSGYRGFGAVPGSWESFYTSSKAKLRTQLQTIGDAVVYAHKSSEACPQARSAYTDLRDQMIQLANQYGDQNYPLWPVSALWESGLSQADAVCSSARRAAGMTATVPKPDEGEMGPPEPPGGVQKAGFPWWIALVGGGLLFLLLNKKGKK